MSAVLLALRVEWTKALASRVMRTTTVLLAAGVAALSFALVGAVTAGNEQVIAQLGPLADAQGWELLTGTTAQITAAGALLAFGIALSWSYGREFTDGTISGLFALPVTRPAIALAKMVVYLLWVTGVAVVLTALILLAGLALGLGPVDAGVIGQLGRQLTLTVLTGLLATPVGVVATLGRGPLPGIAAAVGIPVIANVTVIAAPQAAAWVPLASPALWALQPQAVHGGQLAVVLVVPAAAAAVTALTWQRLQLDR